MPVRGLEGKRIVGVVIARMGSTRVPGKSLKPLAGRSVLGRVLDIARAIRGLDEICIATSDLPADDAIATLANAEKIRCVRGDAERVLDRIHPAAAATAADILVYLGGDCPLLDPAVIDAALSDFAKEPCDYINNYDPPTFPEGMDVNIITRAALDRAFDEALAPSQRIHPFSYLTRHPELFRIRNFSRSPDLSAHHWSLDFPDDLEFLNDLYDRHYRGRPFALDDVLAALRADAELAALDRKLQRGPAMHAFWNSPGIMRDMAVDVLELAEHGRRALAAGHHDVARRCYSEIQPIAGELARYSAHHGGQS
jgi:spore coat polysaccharide biosynthesis protein SpsF (cytidylyltransferase family)